MAQQTSFPWPVCPECGLSASVMNDYITQRFDLAKRLQFKVRLGSCYLCSDVYHREREFLVFAVEELGRTEYSPPVDSLDGLTWEKFVTLFYADEGERLKLSSYQDCFQRETVDTAGELIKSYLSSFSLADLSLLTEERLRSGLASLPSPERTVMALYLLTPDKIWLNDAEFSFAMSPAVFPCTFLVYGLAPCLTRRDQQVSVRNSRASSRTSRPTAGIGPMSLELDREVGWTRTPLGVTLQVIKLPSKQVENPGPVV